MGPGLDVLLVGIAGTDLTHIATEERLSQLFGDNDPNELSNNPETPFPYVFYFSNECQWGAALGSGLGYILHSGTSNVPPQKVKEEQFARIPELKGRFVREMRIHGIEVSPDEVGLYAVNVYDT